jgi:hypothetical protein
MKVRLPVAGARPRISDSEPPVLVAEATLRDPGRPLVCVVGAGEALPVRDVAASLVRAFVAAGLDVDELDVRTGAATDAVGAVARELASLETREGPVVCLGSAVPLYYRASLLLLLSGGLPRSAWASPARALEARADVVLPAMRPQLPAALAHAWRKSYNRTS